MSAFFFWFLTDDCCIFVIDIDLAVCGPTCVGRYIFVMTVLRPHWHFESFDLIKGVNGVRVSVFCSRRVRGSKGSLDCSVGVLLLPCSRDEGTDSADQDAV